MSLRPEDTRLIKQLEDVLIDELDRQHMDGEIEDGSGMAYFDAMSTELTGIPDWYKAITKVMEAYWEEEGR
jgi:hypothetical protein